MGYRTNPIESLLTDEGFVHSESKMVFSEGVRDDENITVYRDAISHVIWLDSLKTNLNEHYKTAQFWSEPILGHQLLSERSGRELLDTKMRLAYVKHQLSSVSRLLDFGCGSGAFLEAVRPFVSSLHGIELSESNRIHLQSAGIECGESLKELGENQFSICTMFHVLEHLEDPIGTLVSIKDRLLPGGIIVIEVPNARDFLLSDIAPEEFKKFTSWSQHLVLYTRDLLRTVLVLSGFKKIEIRGHQRYGLSNHLNWFKNGEPNYQFESRVSEILGSPELSKAYEGALDQKDATDSLLAIAIA